MATIQGPPGLPHDPDDGGSRVAHERVGAGAPTARFWTLSFLLAAGSVAWLLVLSSMERGILTGEAAQHGEGVFGLLEAVPTAAMRMAASLAGATAVFATAHAVRRLSHSEAAGLVAALLVAVDPAFLVQSHLALPAPFLLLAATGSLALVLARHEVLHWLAAIPMTLGVLLEPLFLLWALPLGALLLLRGHIYAAPKHLATAAAQILIVPALVAFPVTAVLGTGPACAAGAGDALLLAALTDWGDGHIAVHGPAIWIGGALTLVGLAAAAVAHMATRFRVARLPGRIQVRLPTPMPALYARSLWLAALWVLAPTPLVWLPLFAAALAMGAAHLSRDGVAFGLILHGALLGFAAVYLVRFWALLTGAEDGVALVQQALPWAAVQACG